MTSTESLIENATKGYIECAMWLADDDAGTGEYEVCHKVDPFARDIATADVRVFVTEHLADVLAYVERIANVEASYSDQMHDEAAAEFLGHDFYLTRNGHGAGFWDRGLGELGERLTTASKSYGEVYHEVNCGELVFVY